MTIFSLPLAQFLDSKTYISGASGILRTDAYNATRDFMKKGTLSYLGAQG